MDSILDFKIFPCCQCAALWLAFSRFLLSCAWNEGGGNGVRKNVFVKWRLLKNGNFFLCLRKEQLMLCLSCEGCMKSIVIKEKIVLWTLRKMLDWAMRKKFRLDQ